MATMSAFSGKLNESNLTDVLRTLVDHKHTGCLKIREGDQMGVLIMENGVILNARTGSYVALHALFQFVAWREARFEFEPGPVPAGWTNDLAAYEPHVLIAGVEFKEQELTLLQQATPPIDSVPRCVTGDALESVEATPADRGLLLLADGRRSVREIAEMVKLSPLDVARTLARFRLAGVLDLVCAKKRSARSAMAAG